MKPRFTSLRNTAFPALIIVPAFFQPAMAQVAVPDSIIRPTADGSVTVTEQFTTASGGRWTVEADSENGSNLKVTLAEGAKLTGAFELDLGINVVTDDYTFENFGEINVGGIGVISRTGDTTIVNRPSGEIIGGNAGIFLARPEMEGEVLGRIEVATSIDQITNGGLIHGFLGGVLADEGISLSLKNEASGLISGNAGAGIISFDDLSVLNLGGITGGFSLNESQSEILGKDSMDGNDGILTNDDANIENIGSIEGLGGSGISAGDGLYLNNSGYISGGGIMELDTIATKLVSEGGFSGIVTGDDADLTNKKNGVIQGSENGIEAGEYLILKNSGDILGGASTGELPLEFSGNSGITALVGADIENDGLVKGGVNGISISHSSYFSEIDISLLARDEEIEVTPVPLFSITNNSGGVIEGNGNGILLSQNSLFLETSAKEEIPLEIPTSLQGTITNRGIIAGLGAENYGIRSIDLSRDRDFTSRFYIPQTVNNYGSISGIEAAIDLGAGADIINLYQGSTINGAILGLGETLLNFINGALSLESPDNVVNGDVEGIDIITKSGTGYAFIGMPGDEYNVEADTINVTGGGLIINGNLSSNSNAKTIINLSNGGQLDGSGDWDADLIVRAGGISAGATTNVLDQALKMERSREASRSTNFSIGSLTINGSVSHSLGSAGGGSLPAIDTLSYLRVDIKPQAEIIAGLNHDIIYLEGEGSTYDLTNTTVVLAPTDRELSLSDGNYTIMNGANPLIGFNANIPIGMFLRQFDSSSIISGNFSSGLGSGKFVFDSVLTNYFTVLRTEDPVITDLEPLSKREIPELSLPSAASHIDSNLVLSISHNYENLPGLTESQAALAAAIDDLVASPDPLIQEFIANLDSSNLEVVQETLALLDPTSSFGLISTQVNTNYRLHRLTENHLAGIRGSSSQFSSVAPSSKDAKGTIVAGPSSTLTSGRGNAWGSFSYDDQDFDSAHSGADYDGDSGSFTAGVDWLVAPDLVVGVVFDGSKSDYNGEGYDSEVDSIRGAVYGTFGKSMGFYSDALIGIGTADFESRVGAGGIFTGSRSNDTSADSFQTLFTAGFAMGTEQLKHGPFAGIEYQTLAVDGYSQGGPIDIRVDGYDVDSLRAIIGYRIGADFGKFNPYASVAYAHEFEDGANTTKATVQGAPFEVAGAEQASAVLLSVGTSVALTQSLSLDVSYRGEIALDDGISSNGISLGLNYNF